jgi:hypothetical protein
MQKLYCIQPVTLWNQKKTTGNEQCEAKIPEVI